MQKKLIITLATTVLVVAAGLVVYALYSQPASAPKVSDEDTVDCSKVVQNWDVSRRVGKGSLSSGQIVDVRYGQHDCFDRIVFDIDSNDVVRYSAEYVPEIIGGGSGEPVEIAGNNSIQLVIGAQVSSDRTPADFGPVDDWNALRQIKRVSSFEGITTFGIGISKEVPFNIFHLPGKDGKSMRIVLDIAH